MKPTPYPTLFAMPSPLEPARAAVAQVPASRLLDFGALMRDEGLSVDLDRMRRDRLYAYERMARAQGSANRRLRRAAETLFVDYEVRPADGAMH
jgi:hypothetical protein